MRKNLIIRQLILMISLWMSVNMQAFTPEPDEFYRIKVDNVLSASPVFLGYLSADILTTNKDSLKIDWTENDLTAWMFKLDTIINDSIFYTIINKETKDTLAFDIPEDDTIAVINPAGLLNQWWMPFDNPDSRTGVLATRDSLTGKHYFLGINTDTVVMIIGSNSSYDSLSFLLEDILPPLPPPPPGPTYLFDTTAVYKIQYAMKTKREYYIGYAFDEVEVFLDKVYAHIPDGQFIANRVNPNSLINRMMPSMNTPSFEKYYVNGILVPDTFLYRGDTVTVIPITDADLDKTNSFLGHKYISPTGLTDSSYYFSVTEPDSLLGRILGNDEIVMLLEAGDTATFLLDEVFSSNYTTGFSQVATLQKQVFTLRSTADPTMYLSSDEIPELTRSKTNAGYYYLREDTIPGTYFLVNTIPTSTLSTNKMLVLNPKTKQLEQAARTSANHTLFQIGRAMRTPEPEPDNNSYLTQFPHTKGKGYYELLVYYDPPTSNTKSLTKDFYDYAALGNEGESMLRAGSYTPYDLQLWVDTAAGWGGNSDKPSFYIVKDVDTTLAGVNNFYITGHFLHVMDSSKIVSNSDYVVRVGSKEYNRLNFIDAKRIADDQLELTSSGQLVSSFANIREYRFYFQETGETDRYYIMSEGLGDVDKPNERGYLSMLGDKLYVGPRDHALKVQVRGSTVANERVPQAPPDREVIIMGGNGTIELLNVVGQPVYVYNILGRLIAHLTPTSDHETIPVQKGLLIVKAGDVTRKVVVK